MLAYRHAFHAGNHADVLKHCMLVAVLRAMNVKDKGYRLVDTHAGAGGYSLLGRSDLPPALADYLAQVRQFNGEGALMRYPGSPMLARQLLRAQDQLRLFELHPTDFGLLESALGGQAGVEVRHADGFAGLKAFWPPPTRRGVLLIDPSYEIKTDYAAVLAALREALARFAEGVVLIWYPQLLLRESSQLLPRLKAAAAGARKGWLHARLTVAEPDAQGFGLLGSGLFVVNPPHTLRATLAPVLPFLARQLGRYDAARGVLEQSREAAS
jgi:23S rRNA (adenine2030-N6)-methyltransferase